MWGGRARWERIVIVAATAAFCSCSMTLGHRENPNANEELKASLERTLQQFNLWLLEKYRQAM